MNGNKKKMIIVRGVASSGKSVAARAFIEKVKDNFFIFSLEDIIFFHMIPKKYLVDGDESHLGFSIERDSKGHITNVKSSEWGSNLYLSYISTLSTYTKQGFNIICEGNLVTEESLDLILKQTPEDYEVYVFGFDVNLDLLEAREISRSPERTPGFARHQYEKMKLSLYLNDLTFPIHKYSEVERTADNMISYYEKEKGNSPKEIYKRFLSLVFNK